MERRTKTPANTDPAPMRDQAVELAIHRLDVDLRRALGDSAEFVVVISRDVMDTQHVQAMTNATVARAHALLRACDACGFDSLN